MPVYEYTALDHNGKSISGFMDAHDLKTAKQQLRKAGQYPTAVSEVEGKKNMVRTRPTLFGTRIRPMETAAMTRQLATLTASGFPLTQALNALVAQTRKPALKRLISTVKDTVEAGSSFAEALAQHPRVFPQVYVQMIRAGEASGTLAIVLDRLAEIAEHQNRLRQKLRAAMAYPLLMTLIGAGVLFFLLSTVVPNITTIFEEMNQSLPWSTRLLIRAGDLAATAWALPPVGLILLLAAFHLGRRRPEICRTMDRITLALPLVGELAHKAMAARFARTLGALLENGVALLDALKILERITGNQIMEAAIRRAGDEVEKGRNLGTVLDEARVFPPMMVQMLQVGEQSGNLEPMLKRAAQIHEDEVETTLTSLTALLEPVIILFMALVVGFIVLSICLPIFEMNQLVG